MISAQHIKELREKTGAGISDIKKALEENGGDLEKARRAIEQLLGSLAGKRAGRETRSGLVEVYVHSNGRIGSMVEFLCETDFVARNLQFKECAHEIAMHIAAMNPQDADALLGQPFVKDEEKTVREFVNEASGRFGENILVGKFSRFEI